MTLTGSTRNATIGKATRVQLANELARVGQVHFGSKLVAEDFARTPVAELRLLANRYKAALYNRGF